MNKSIYKSPAGERAIMDQYDALLARWPVPYTTLEVGSRYGPTFVVACGSESAPPLVLIHGAGSNSATWAGDVGEYSRHYRVYAVDLLGEPGKSAPIRPDWKSSAYAEEDTLRDARKIADRMQKLVPELTAKIIPQAGHVLYNTSSHVVPFLRKLA